MRKNLESPNFDDLQNPNNIILADTPLEYPRSFVLGGKKIFKVGGKGKKKKKLGKKLKEEEKKERGRIEPPSHVRIDLPMPYPSPTVTLKLHCEQFWTFIVIVTFDLLRTLLRMRVYEQTDQDNYSY